MKVHFLKPWSGGILCGRSTDSYSSEPDEVTCLSYLKKIREHDKQVDDNLAQVDKCGHGPVSP